MTYYLIDFENVHAAGIGNPAICAEGDIVCIYYGADSQDLPLETIHAFFQKQVGLQTVPVNTGSKNALDFQLTTHLGYLIGSGEHSGAAYRIVSNDTGFDCVVTYWKDRGIDIARIADLTGVEKKTAKARQKPKAEPQQKPEPAQGAEPKPSAESRTKKVKKNSKGIISTTKAEMLQYLEPDEYEDELLDIFNGYKTRTSINNYFAKHFRDSQKASAIYKKLKPLMAAKGKS
jgi:hypothetical protein